MKNTILSFVLAVFLLATAVSAVSENGLHVDINSTQVYFSGDKDSFDTSDVFVSNQGVLPLVNKLNSPVTLKFANTGLVHESDIESKANITAQVVSLSALEKRSLPIKLVSTKNIEAGIYTGTLQIVNNSNPSQVFDEVAVRVLVPSLEITDISVKDTVSDISDTKLEKGQKFTVTVDYKNLADQTDLENVNVKVSVYQGDKDVTYNFALGELLVNIDGDDLEDDKDVSDMSNGKSSSASFDFEMPFDISDGDDFTVLAEITADSQDTSSTFYARDVKKTTASVPDNKVEITKLTATPATLACGTNRTKITAQVRNIGDSSEDVQLFLRNSATGFERFLNNGEDVQLDDKFDDEDSFTQTVEENVMLNDLKAGQNTYTLVAYFNDGDSNAQRDVVITAQSCAPTTTTDFTTTTTSNNDVIVVPPTTTGVTTTPVSNPSYVQLKDVSSGFDSDLILPIAIGIGGLVIGVIVALLVIPRG